MGPGDAAISTDSYSSDAVVTWFRVDDKFHDHPKVRKLRADKMPAIGLWSLGGSWAADNLTDGFVPTEIVSRFDPKERYARRLVEVGLWIPAEQDGEVGYRFHEWTEYQPSKTEVTKQREDSRERVRRWRARNGQNRPAETPSYAASNGVSNGVSNDVGNALQTPLVTGEVTAPPTQPNPTQPQPRSGYVGKGSLVDQRAEDQQRGPSKIPEDWTPHAGQTAVAAERGLDVTHEAAQFRAHALDKGRTSQDWHAAFDSWLGRASTERGARLRVVHADPPGIHRDPKTGRVVEW